MSSKKKKAKKRESTARRMVEYLFSPGRASRHIEHFQIRPGDKIVLALRVSKREQDREGNLRDQGQFLRPEIEKENGNIIDEITYVGSGFDTDWLLPAFHLAEKHGAIVLAETTDRFIRNRFFKSNNPRRAFLRATEAQLRELSRLANGIKLMTYVRPDATLAELARHRSLRGQAAKKNRGGRPRSQTPGYKKRERNDKLPLASRLYEEGQSLSKISQEIGVPKSTIYDWIKKQTE